MKKRILFVCAADIATSQTFIDVVGSLNEFSILVFNSARKEPYPPQPWKCRTISILRPRHPDNIKKWYQLPDNRLVRGIIFYLKDTIHFTSWLLKIAIRLWRPDIVHTIAINPEAWITWQALKKMKNRPVWLVAGWSSDIYWDRFRKNEIEKIKIVFQNCDCLIADNVRDLKIAEKIGIEKKKILKKKAIPGGGGISERLLSREKNIGRRADSLILIPKGYDAVWHKPHIILDALRILDGKNIDFRALFLGSDEDVQIWCKFYSPRLQKKIIFKNFFQQDEYFSLLEESRIVLAPSLTDGTPNSLLETMAVGALPIYSPHQSVKEWIRDGVNGLLVNPLNSVSMATAINRGLRDNVLFSRAIKMNRSIIEKRASCTVVARDMLEIYNQLLESAGKKQS